MARDGPEALAWVRAGRPGLVPMDIQAARVDGLGLTRCARPGTFGGLFTAACGSGVGIAYTTHGEGISEGLRRGDNHALAVALLGRRWPDPVSAGAARTG